MKRSARELWLLSHLFICGVSTLAVEVAAFRLLAPSFGSTQFITTNVLGVVLASLAAGYYIGGRLADRAPRPPVLYCVSIAAGAMLVLLPFAAEPVLAAARGSLTQQNGSLFATTLASMAVLFAGPFLFLGMASPFVIRLLADDAARTGSRSGVVFAVSTLGSILGAYLPALVTVPWIGTRATIQTFGGIVVLSAAAGLLSERKIRGGAAALSLTLIPAWLVARPLAPPTEPGVIEQRETEYHLARVVRFESYHCNALQLNEGQSYHSIWYDDGRLATGIWGYFHPFPALLAADAKQQKPDVAKQQKIELRVCILGLAAGTVATQYQRSYGASLDLKIDGVEIDGDLVELGRRHFSLREGDLTVHVEDARTFLARTQCNYDLIIGDAYRQPYIPAHLATRDFFEIAKQHLRPGGIFAVNVGSIEDDSALLRGIQNSVMSAFGPSYSFERFTVVNEDVHFNNHVVMASDRAISPRWEALEGAEIQHHKNNALATWTALTFDPAGPLFTDDRAPVEWYTDLSLLKFILR